MAPLDNTAGPTAVPLAYALGAEIVGVDINAVPSLSLIHI